ncbi:MAG TPA: 3-deoxy-7-phosphoheptulonate synthase [Chitinivibrionales bacterium]|nr:3-deoxy-7-phosphoheptulonate synthase [Chitinivibrionales bacterium]
MSFKKLKKVPTVKEIISLMPLPKGGAAVKKQRDEEIIAALTGASDRFVLIIGPCSAHDEDAVCDYITRLAKIGEQVKDRLVLVPRIYTNKPRTTGVGYKGMAHQPDPQKEPNIVEGLRAIRRMHIRALTETGLSAADEMLYPENYPYLEDLLSYVTIGARSVENQAHRLTVSGLDVPIGAKNPTSGDLEVMFNAIGAAQVGHVFLYNGWEVSTSGNPYAHAVLRGAVNHYGQNIPNYHFEDLMLCAEKYHKRGLVNPAIIVDTNHSNSNKRFKEQPRIALEVMESRRHSPLLAKMVRGLMVESFIEEGTQKADGNVYGKSITDPCLGWDDTERLILELADKA